METQTRLSRHNKFISVLLLTDASTFVWTKTFFVILLSHLG